MAGAVVGTSSARRQSWIKHLRPDLEFKPLRGNVPTRIGKLEHGYDAILLAAAGLAGVPWLGRRLAQALDRMAQRLTERRHARMRRDLLRFEEQNEDALAFAGPSE